MKKILTIKTTQMWLWLAVLLIVWELSARLGLVNTVILPPFSRVAARIVSELFTGSLGIQVLNSMRVISVGFLLSFGIAFIVTALCVWLPPVDSLFNMISTIMNPLPAVAILPLVIMWFGINTGAMLVLITHGVLWALLRHLLDGLRSVPPMYREWGKNIGLPPWRMFTDIILFAIMSDFLAGVRIGWGRAWRALISFGMIGTMGGLGFYIHTARAVANITNVMSGVVIIIIIGILFESVIFKQIEKRTIRKWGMTHE
jgi:NitT/TauT family transport system permease protein